MSSKPVPHIANAVFGGEKTARTINMGADLEARFGVVSVRQGRRDRVRGDVQVVVGPELPKPHARDQGFMCRLKLSGHEAYCTSSSIVTGEEHVVNRKKVLI